MIIRRRLDELLQEESSRVLSVYLNLSPSINDSGRSSYSIWLKSNLKRIKDMIKPSDKNLFESFENRVRFIVESALPKDKSIIIFLGNDFEDIIYTRVAVENEISFGKLNAGQLLWIKEEYRPFLVILIDSKKIDVFKIHFNNIEKTNSFTLDIDTSDWRKQKYMPRASPRDSLTKGSIGGGNRIEAYEDRIEANLIRFLSNAQGNLSLILKEQAISEFILCGTETVYEKYKKLLNKEQINKLVGSFPISVDASLSVIMEKATSIFWDYEKIRESGLVDTLLEQSSNALFACTGIDKTLKNIQSGRAEKVVISRKLTDTIKICVNCDNYQIINESSCNACGSQSFIEGAIKSLLPQLALKHGVSIEIVGNEAGNKLMSYGGIGTFWRY